MRVKQRILFSLIIFSFLSFIYGSAYLNNVINNGATYTYSDFIVPGVELAWDVVKFTKEDSFVWQIIDGISIEEGDEIKLIVNTDPDELSLPDYDSLQNTTQPWADHLLNDEFIGDMPYIIQYFVDPFEEMGEGPGRHSPPESTPGFILPPDRNSPTDSIDNLFEYLLDELSIYQFNNDSGFYEVKITEDLFIINWEFHEEGMISGTDEPYKLDRIFEISYNLAWGYLDRMKIYEFYERGIIGEEQDILELVLLNSKSTQRVSIEWITGLVAI
ncbi:MAG: hypothetical protein FK732_06875, partial [Asgard group archaeon]|nr:hypothetical protein [Asgard group archaeon]